MFHKSALPTCTGHEDLSCHLCTAVPATRGSCHTKSYAILLAALDPFLLFFGNSPYLVHVCTFLTVSQIEASLTLALCLLSSTDDRLFLVLLKFAPDCKSHLPSQPLLFP